VLLCVYIIYISIYIIYKDYIYTMTTATALHSTAQHGERFIESTRSS
jgi:hypothetical protein